MTEKFHAQINDAELVGVCAGGGPPLLFLHAGVADKRMWHPQMAAFSAGFQTIAYDRRGFGETTTPDESFSHVEDLRTVLDQFGVESVTLVGCSQGGRIAIDFTLAFPDRVRALVLIAPAISGAPDVESIPPAIETLVDTLDRADEAGDLERINAIEAHLWLDGPTSPEGRVGGELRELFLDMNGIALSMPDLDHEIDPPGAFTRVSELALPTLVIWGDLDFPHVNDRCQYLVESIPNAKGERLSGVAHLPNLEQPQIVNHLLRTFLTEPRQ